MKQFFKFFFASMTGTIVALLVVVGILFGVIGIIASSAKSDQVVKIKDNSVIRLTLQEEMQDRGSNDPLENFDFINLTSTPQLGLNDVLSALEKGSQDDRIKGLFLDMTVVSIGMGRMNEVREAIVNFKDSGKFVYAYGEVLDQNAYYIASAADKIFLHPGGVMELKGLSAQRMFLKGTFDKLDIEMQVVRHGKYKSAVEPFIREDMSEANRIQTNAFITSLWDNMLVGISESRGLEMASLNAYADQLEVGSPEKAVEQNLIDGVKYKDEVIAEMKQRLELEEDDDIAFVKVQKYRKAKLPDAPEKSLEDFKNKIAVVYASGDIVSGKSTDGSMGSKTISEAIEKAREDEKIKAVVLRVNSPGGSSLASDVIWREVELTKSVKPVVVSMGNLAASGGYYISCGADKILADPNTITGSIGVFGLIPNLEGFMKNKLGITFDTVNTNTYSDFATGMRPLKEVEMNWLTNMIERIYDDFVNKVAEGRSMTYAEVDSIGQGRVWSGTDAIEIGLVDELGGLNRAIEVAAEMAELENYQLKELPEQKDPFETILSDISENMETRAARKYFGEHYEKFESVYSSLNSSGVYARMPFNLLVE